MQTHHFDITTDATRGLLIVRMRGHWTSEIVNAYKKAVLRAAADLLAAGSRQGEVLALVDARDLSAQSQNVVAEFKANMDREGLLPRRLATVTSSILFRRQVERIAIPNQRLFNDEDEALAWLMSTDRDA